MKVGLVGLGRMGRAIVARLKENGFEVTGWDRDAVAMKAGTDKGMTAAPHPRAVADSANVVISIITEDNGVKHVFRGKDGFLSGDVRGKLFIDMSTLQPMTGRELAPAVAAAGAKLIDSPVFGTIPHVLQGKLYAMVGGDAAEGAIVYMGGLPKEKMPGFAGYAARYKARFNEDVITYSPYSYDGTIALLTAMKDANSTEFDLFNNDVRLRALKTLAERLQDIGIAALTVHGRTRVQMYKGEADWTLIGKIKENPRMKIPVFGNGDIDSPEKAKEYFERYQVDGIMIGRAAIGFPWVFNQIKAYLKDGTIIPAPDIQERIATVQQHLDFSIRWKGDRLGIFEMRRHYAPYFKGLPDFKSYRTRLVEAPDYASVGDILKEVSEVYSLVSQ